MNQTKPKTVEDILNKYDTKFKYLDRETGYIFGEEEDEYIKNLDTIKLFIRQEITTLLESFNTEFWDAPGSFAAGYNARNRELEKEINKILGI